MDPRTATNLSHRLFTSSGLRIVIISHELFFLHIEYFIRISAVATNNHDASRIKLRWFLMEVYE